MIKKTYNRGLLKSKVEFLASDLASGRTPDHDEDARHGVPYFWEIFDQLIKTLRWENYFEQNWSSGGLNPGLLTCEASTLPLSYSPLSLNVKINQVIFSCRWISLKSLHRCCASHLKYDPLHWLDIVERIWILTRKESRRCHWTETWFSDE